MATTLHRLQVSLPHWQVQFLSERARHEGVSLAEIIRRLIQDEARAKARQGDAAELWGIAGIAEDPHPLIDETPVSERPDLYLSEPAASPPAARRRPSRRPKPRR
jgi:hypothetical protein